ncbi:glycerophosphodiester phosphodiesterase family protein [Terasakiella sp. A23]|uniref:glycerophosphodiester phosphodiesterase family protein n=1 Tax=Terasakiella sp. FCG-A23 TaxID=3080561 RepID=UPI0029556C81|nr:glycerophosphodiester phosphodiesterase family protein [Terasakiella sp. A23]MDV7341415.1 glycerophosphodiester phosphodiesterase family protein [Terasakiella sp. A23]
MLMSPVIGHRGAAGLVPENTLDSIRKAASLGCGWIEADACLLADGEVVLFHDETLDRCTNGTGRVRIQAWDEVRKLDAGNGLKVPLLTEAIDLCRGLGLGFNIELKVQEDEGVELASAVSRIVKGRDCGELLISSFDQAALTAFDLPYRKGLICEDLPENWQEVDCVSVHQSVNHVSKQTVHALKAAGKEVYVFTVNEATKAQELFDMGVDGFFSDRPDRLTGPAHPRTA